MLTEKLIALAHTDVSSPPATLPHPLSEPQTAMHTAPDMRAWETHRAQTSAFHCNKLLERSQVNAGQLVLERRERSIPPMPLILPSVSVGFTQTITISCRSRSIG